MSLEADTSKIYHVTSADRPALPPGVRSFPLTEYQPQFIKLLIDLWYNETLVDP